MRRYTVRINDTHHILDVEELARDTFVVPPADGRLVDVMLTDHADLAQEYEPLLLLPIGAGAILTNLPLSPLVGEGGMLTVLYNMGITNELFPLLIFIGIGALTDFGPLLENPKMVLLGAAGQFGIFLTLILALVLGFTHNQAASIGIIGAIDGPTSIYVSNKLAPMMPMDAAWL